MHTTNMNQIATLTLDTKVIAKEYNLTRKESQEVVVIVQEGFDDSNAFNIESIEYAVKSVIAQRPKLKCDRLSYVYSVISLDGGDIHASKSKELSLSEFCDEHVLYENDLKDLKKLDAGRSLLCYSHTIHETTRLLVFAKFSKEVEAMRFSHDGNEPRDIYEMWDNDSIFMDGGEKEILKLGVNESLDMKDSGGYTNNVIRVK